MLLSAASWPPPNENLEPYIFYLRRKIEASADTPRLGDEKLRREIGLPPI